MLPCVPRGLSRCLAACIVLIGIVACSKSARAPGEAPAAAATQSASPAAGSVSEPAVAAEDPGSPCRVLSDASVRGAFPGAKAGVRNRSREEYGIAACQWSTGSGDFVAEIWKAKGSTADNEIRGLASGFIDPTKANAAGNVRFEPVAGVGDQAFAVVETEDPRKGILTDVALLVASHGDTILVLTSTDLARGDRATALKTLTALGGDAVGRL